MLKAGSCRSIRKKPAGITGWLPDPITQAAARAIAAACGTLTTPTNALGFLFYAAAALVYDQGLDLPASEMEELTRQIWQDAHASLSAQSVKDEPCPAKIQWHC